MSHAAPLLSVVLLVAVACGGAREPSASGSSLPRSGDVAWRHLGMVERKLDDGTAAQAVEDADALKEAWSRYDQVRLT